MGPGAPWGRWWGSEPPEAGGGAWGPLGLVVGTGTPWGRWRGLGPPGVGGGTRGSLGQAAGPGFPGAGGGARSPLGQAVGRGQISRCVWGGGQDETGTTDVYLRGVDGGMVKIHLNV